MSTTQRNEDSERWGQIREKVLERDGYECRFCGMSDKEHGEENGAGLDVHHIIPRKDGGEDTIRNLVALCRSCHRTMESLHGQAMGEIASKNDYTDELVGVNRAFSDGWDDVQEIDNKLADFIEGHPVFKDQFHIYDEQPDSQNASVECHEWQTEALPTNSTEVTVPSEWAFAVLWGYKEGVIETLCDLETWAGLPFDDLKGEGDE